MARGANNERFLDEDHCYPEKLNKNCDRCKSKAQACDIGPWSGLTCERCVKAGVPCEWSAPETTASLKKGINEAAKMRQQGLILGKSGGAIKIQNDVKKTNKSKSAGADEFMPGLRELGAGRHKKEEVKAGPSRIDREREERPKPKPTEFDFFKGDKYGGSKRQSRPEDDRSRRPERDSKHASESRRKRDLSPESSALSSESSPESTPRKPKRKERDERDDHSSSKRRSPLPPAASALKGKDQDRMVSATSAASVPGPLKKRRQIVESSEEEDDAVPKSPEITTKRLDDDGGRKEKKPRLEDRDETPRKRPRDEDERPKQRDRSRDEFSRRKESRTDDNGRPRPKERVERDRSREDRRDDADERRKARRDEGVRVDRDDKDRPKKIKREDREAGAKSTRDRDDGEPSGKRPREERDRPPKDGRDEGDKFFDSLNKSKRDDVDRDEGRIDPARKKRRLSDENDMETSAKAEDEPGQQKTKQLSVLAQRALDPKRTKPDTPSHSGDVSPVTRKPARPMGNSSGRSTPMGKSKPPMGDAISDLLTASLAGASAGYASSLGVKSASVRDRYSGRMDRPSIKPAAPVVPVTRGTLDLMGTLKSISDFQTAAKRRYEHSYGLKPEGTAKTTQTTAFMKRFREQRAQGAYNNTLSTLCTPPGATMHAKDPAEASDVQKWLAENGTAPLAAPRSSAPVVGVTLAEPDVPAPSAIEPVKVEESGSTSDNPIAI